MTTPKRRLTRVEIVKLSNLLEANIEKLDGGLVRYRDDWNDEKIARHIAPDLNATHAARLRTELFGPLISARRSGGDDNVSQQQLADLQLQIKNLQQRLAEQTEQRLVLEKRHRRLWTQFDKLCDALSLNRVLDVRSCKYQEPAPINRAETNVHT